MSFARCGCPKREEQLLSLSPISQVKQVRNPEPGGVAMKAINLFGVSSRVATAVKSTSLALLCLALFSLTAFGQQATTGNIALTVTDPSNAVVAGATVTVTNMETGATRTGETNTSGTVEIQTLTPANYTVTVEAKGFKKSVSHDIIISVSQTTTVTIPLEIGVP